MSLNRGVGGVRRTTGIKAEKVEPTEMRRGGTRQTRKKKKDVREAEKERRKERAEVQGYMERGR